MTYKNGDIVKIKDTSLNSKSEAKKRFVIVNANTETNVYMISCLNMSMALGSIETVSGCDIAPAHIYFDNETDLLFTDHDLTNIYKVLKRNGETEAESVDDYITNCTTGNGLLEKCTNISQFCK